MIRIAEYDDVNPLQVLHLNLLCLDFALTPELVGVIRRMDARPFPFFAVYAMEGSAVIGQVGVFRLPMISLEGAAEVGGVWAVSTHPAWRGKGVASLLLDEAHRRMAAAGLRYSTLGADSYRVSHALYHKHGYHDLHSPAMALGRADALPARTDLRVELAGVERLGLADQLFDQGSRGHLGFARRHVPWFTFLHTRNYLNIQDLWLVWQGDTPLGYAVTTLRNQVLRVQTVLLSEPATPLAAVTALARATEARYVQVRLDQAGDTTAFAQAGFETTIQTWGTFMVKPLAAGATLAEFRQSYGLDDGRFLSSYMDMT